MCARIQRTSNIAESPVFLQPATLRPRPLCISTLSAECLGFSWGWGCAGPQDFCRVHGVQDGALHQSQPFLVTLFTVFSPESPHPPFFPSRGPLFDRTWFVHQGSLRPRECPYCRSPVCLCAGEQWDLDGTLWSGLPRKGQKMGEKLQKRTRTDVCGADPIGEPNYDLDNEIRQLQWETGGRETGKRKREAKGLEGRIGRGPLCVVNATLCNDTRVVAEVFKRRMRRVRDVIQWRRCEVALYDLDEKKTRSTQVGLVLSFFAIFRGVISVPLGPFLFRWPPFLRLERYAH